MKKAQVFITVLLIAALMLSTCGISALAEGGDDSVIKWACSQYIADWCSEVAAAFTAETGKAVQIIEVAGDDAATKFLMMMQSGETAPDVIQEDGFMVKSDAAAGYLAPLGDYIANWSEFDQVTPAILENGRGSDGVMYGIPLATDTQGFWYDKDLFAAAGLPVPFEPKSWEDMLSAARTLKEANADSDDFIPMFVYNTNQQDASMRTFQLLYNGTGGKLFDGEAGKWVVDRENIVKTLDFVNTIYNVDHTNGPMGVTTAANVNELISYDYLMKGKCGIAMCVNLLVLWQEGMSYPWPEALDHLAYAKVPTIDGSGTGYVSISGGHTWAIPAKANNKDGGWDLIAFAMNYENHLNYVQKFSGIAVRQDVAQAPEYLDQAFSVVDICTDMVNYTYVRPSVEGYPDVSVLYSTMIEDVTLGSTPEEALDVFQAELIRLMGEDKVEVIG